MATGVTTYQCPACTGPLRFDEKLGKLKCDYCGSVYGVEEMAAAAAEKEKAAAAVQDKHEAEAARAEQQAAAGGWGDGEADGLRALVCSSCGAQLVADATTAATSCPYCGNPTIVPARFEGALRPDLVLPFQKSKKEAEAALAAYYRGKTLLPRSFCSQNHIEEIRGVYVPFWLYDGQADGQAGYAAQNVRSWREGDYNVTETSFYDVRRAGAIRFAQIPVDGSTKMPDAHMDAIEPFDYKALKPFATSYLPGFLAERYDQDADVCEKRAGERAVNTLSEALRGTVGGYASVRMTSFSARFVRSGARCALLPVWMLSTRWQGKSFLFAMNGQTGRLIGDLPVDRGRYLALFLKIALPLAAVLAAVWFGLVM